MKGRRIQSKPMSIFVVLTVPILICTGLVWAQEPSWPYAQETREQRDARMAWWREARFGMFIHWGVYSVPAGTYNGKKIGGIGEWIMNNGKIPVAVYKEYAKQFNPVKYDPEAWVSLAQEAGMKYIIITSKHHDGFALFDSKVTDWDVVDATPYGKDLLKPLAEACQRHGMKLGFYYSQAQDWCHPGGAAAGGHWDPAQDGDMDRYIAEIAAPQVREILTHYGQVAVLWWDTPIGMNQQRADQLQPLINLQPGIITNNRLGGGYRGDLETPEQHIPATGLDYDWETCMTMNNTWGYKSYDQDWKSTEVLIHNLVDIASKGGNYLLNVGPTAQGEIPPASVKRLHSIGQWMHTNSESIYGTTASPFTKLAWGRCTKKVFCNGAVLYLHVFDWPSTGILRVPGLKNEVMQAYFLADLQHTIPVKHDEDGVILTLPASALDSTDTVLVLKVHGQLDVEAVLPKPNSQGILTLPAALAEIHNPQSGTHARLEEKNGQTNIGFWTDPEAEIQWDFKIEQAQAYDIRASVACESDTHCHILLGRQEIDCSIAATGDYETYQEIKLGTALLASSGRHSLQIKPDKGGWRPLNIRYIRLQAHESQ